MAAFSGVECGKYVLQFTDMGLDVELIEETTRISSFLTTFSSLVAVLCHLSNGGDVEVH